MAAPSDLQAKTQVTQPVSGSCTQVLSVLPALSKNPTCVPQEIVAAHGSGRSKHFVVGILSGGLNVDNSAVNMYSERNEPHQRL